jgi:hypothetical protein
MQDKSQIATQSSATTDKNIDLLNTDDDVIAADKEVNNLTGTCTRFSRRIICIL